MLNEELIGDELTKAVIASLEVCDVCERVSECLSYGSLATGYNPDTRKPIYRALWMCWQCWGDTATACPESGQGA